MKTGPRDKRRTISLKDVKTYIDDAISRSGKCFSDFLKVVVGRHAFMDITQVHLCEIKPLDTIHLKEAYIQASQELIRQWRIDEEQISKLGIPVCQLYRDQISAEVDGTIYVKNCARKRKISLKLLLPCK